jgi:hypothetical protein
LWALRLEPSWALRLEPSWALRLEPSWGPRLGPSLTLNRHLTSTLPQAR